MTFAASIFSLTPRQSPFRGSEGVQLRSSLNEHGGTLLARDAGVLLQHITLGRAAGAGFSTDR